MYCVLYICIRERGKLRCPRKTSLVINVNCQRGRVLWVIHSDSYANFSRNLGPISFTNHKISKPLRRCRLLHDYMRDFAKRNGKYFSVASLCPSKFWIGQCPCRECLSWKWGLMWPGDPTSERVTTRRCSCLHDFHCSWTTWLAIASESGER